MGFCLFDNVAVAAELAIRELGVERVFILDWDVHHGNGTAEIFRRRRGRAVREHPPGGPVPRHRRAGGRGLGGGRGLHDQPARARGFGGGAVAARCWSTWCCRRRLRSSRSWCCSRRASTPTWGTRWRGAACRRSPSRQMACQVRDAAARAGRAAGGRAGGRLRTARAGGVRAGDAGGAGGRGGGDLGGARGAADLAGGGTVRPLLAAVESCAAERRYRQLERADAAERRYRPR